jgi:MarR family transcriptional regulator, 2-MHQ and catechol-resistance regulon repressor
LSLTTNICYRVPVVKFVPSSTKLRRADPSLAKDARAFYAAFSDLIRVYQCRDRDRICCHDISVTQCYALEALARRRSMTLNELATALSLDKSTSSRVVDALERKGYVARLPHPDDGRAVELKITRLGGNLYSLVVGKILAEEQSLLAAFSPPVRRAMTQMILRLARAAEGRNRTVPAEAAVPDFC